MIYTSNFSSTPKLLRVNITPVRISIGKPKSGAGLQVQEKYLKLAPNGNLFYALKSKKISLENYFVKYREQLNKLDAAKTVKELNELGEDVALLCFCKHRCNCHRNIVAEWLKDELELNVLEFGTRQKVFKKADLNSNLLFD